MVMCPVIIEQVEKNGDDAEAKTEPDVSDYICLSLSVDSNCTDYIF